MKILLVGFAKIKYMPYLHFYLTPFLSQGHRLHLLYWDRDLSPDQSLPEEVVLHRFVKRQQDEAAKVGKLFNFWAFRKFAKKLLQKEKFDLIIVLSTLPAVVLKDILCRNYPGRFVFDYRDYTYEGFALYRQAVAALAKKAAAVFISSGAFRDALPDLSNIYLTHNLDSTLLSHREVRRALPRQRQVLRLSFWGLIRHEELNRRVIEQFANDSRFELHYYGRMESTAFRLQTFCRKRSIENVFFHGEYRPEQRLDFAAKTDILLNLYENDTATKRAMGNKYYDGLAFYLPQLCTKGSYMGDAVEKNGVGLLLAPEQPMPQRVWEYYNSIHWAEFEQCCDNALSQVLRETEQARQVVEMIGKRG